MRCFNDSLINLKIRVEPTVICCRSRKRIAGNGTYIKICRNCQIVDYCSEAHQTLAWWRRGRLSHKVMCPFLKRYRLVVKAENRIDTEPVERQKTIL
jgi:hypothetical protein